MLIFWQVPTALLLERPLVMSSKLLHAYPCLKEARVHKMVRWLIAWLVGWLVHWLIEWWVEKAAWSDALWVDWLVGWYIGWYIGWYVGWHIGWYIGWYVGWHIGWYIGWYIGYSVYQLTDDRPIDLADSLNWLERYDEWKQVWWGSLEDGVAGVDEMDHCCRGDAVEENKK